MRIGIYNRWLHTMGGAERYTLAMADCLATLGDVELLTHSAASESELARRMGVRPGTFAIRFLPDWPDHELASASAAYDLFVNACYMSTLPSRARASLLIVYFPAPLRQSRKLAVFRLLAPRLLTRLLGIPEFYRGFFPPEWLGRRMFRWTASEATIRVPVTAPGERQILRFELLNPGHTERAAKEVCFLVAGRPVAECRLELRDLGSQFVDIEVPAELVVHAMLDIGIAVQAESAVDGRRVGIGVGNVLRLGDRRSGVEVYQKVARRLQRWHAQGYCGANRLWLNSYDGIYAISEYSRRWVREYWARDAAILYPPVDLDLPRGPKRNVILTVGRFFAGSHNKKHIDLIRRFKAMVETGFAGWEYHLAGGSSPGLEHEHYLAAIRREAEGYPVHLHVDLPLTQLRRLYGDAKVYWHATGLGEDATKDPARFEHFGITTVEAMAAGAVPVVIGKAGQVEIVGHGVNGFLWQTLDELERHTRTLAADDTLREALAAAALARSAQFGEERFRERLAEIVGGLPSPKAAPLSP